MSSRIVNQGILFLSEAIGGVIRKGQPVPVAFGALIGGAAGASSGMIASIFILPGMLFGLIIGALITAPFFPSPPKLLGEVFALAESKPPGQVLEEYIYHSEYLRSVTLLMENALYTVINDKVTADSIVETLNKGMLPEIAGESLFPLSTIDRLILPEDKELNPVRVAYRSATGEQFREVCFKSQLERDNFLNALERHMEWEFESAQETVSLFSAALWPLVLVSLVALLTAGGAYLSSVWIANPPPPPLGKAEQDDIVKLFIWARPQGILMIGATLAAAAFVWLSLRFVYPPHVRVLRHKNSAAVAAST